MLLASLPPTPHIQSATLPSAGGYTTQVPQALAADLGRVTVIVSYTRGATGGYPRFRLAWTFIPAGASAIVALGTVLDTNIDPSSPPAGRLALSPLEINGPAPALADALVFTLALDVQAGAAALAVLASEAGVIASPGTLAMWLAGTRST